jgi:uncharacterized glyoxalase superfamily protein PhnB/predicted kinase
MTTHTELTPLLVVRDAARAIDFYAEALSASRQTCFAHGEERRISHADLTMGETRFSLTEEAPSWNSVAPPTLGGSPVVLQLKVANAEQAVARARSAGAEVIFAPRELLGERMARVRDPFGHLWILRQPLRELSMAEEQRERDAIYRRAMGAAPKESPSVSDAPGAHQAEKGKVHLVLGPVGAGKSTYAQELAGGGRTVRLTLDDWMTRLFRPDRPDAEVMTWYVERAARCVEQIWRVALEVTTTGTDAVLEIGLIRRQQREHFYRRLDATGLDLEIHVLDADRAVRRERVLERNRARGDTFSMEVPPDVFELASDMWEPPDEGELTGRRVRFVRTDDTEG